MRTDRQIKFRGRWTDYGEWVYGYLIHDDIIRSRGIAIGTEAMSCKSEVLYSGFRVIPETVGQFTGLTDENEKEIYEGDILQSFEHGQIKQLHVVRYFDGRFWAVLDNKPKECTACWLPFCRADTERVKIIGNIHDNPDLLTIKQTI
jgi:uncharacterized phage protein (TIGR01671 family)